MSKAVDYSKEVWKTIALCPNYSISTFGRVRRDTWSSRGTGLLKPSKNSYGYLQVDLRDKGKRVHGNVGRLVALAFIPPDPTRDEVNHKDGVKTNNHVENLEWSTRSENIRHAYINGLRVAPKGQDAPMAKLTTEQVKAIRCLIALGHPRSVIAHLFSVTPESIVNIRKGKTWSSV